jgi:glycerophosphoryl diester phosphodiesterase
VQKNITIDEAIAELGFIPEVYSPYFLAVNADMIRYARENAIKIIPWTVNSTEAFESLIGLGVDGIITDYPDLIPEADPQK